MCEYGTGTNYCDGKKSDEPLFACIDGFWVEQIGQTCGCVENQCVTNSDSNIGFRCIKDMSMPCLDGNALTSCSSNTECGKCLNGERRCSADGAFVEECRKGNWLLKAECDFGCSNQSCIEAKPCTESTECEDGEICTDGYCIKKVNVMQTRMFSPVC